MGGALQGKVALVTGANQGLTTGSVKPSPQSSAGWDVR